MPRRWRALGLVAAGGAAIIVGLGALSYGPLAPALVEGLADGRRIWRLGTLDLEGVSGTLGALRIDRATLTDSAGVWLEAQDLRLDWRPFALLGGEASIQNARAESLAILRRPVLLPARPPSDQTFDVRLDTLALPQITLAEGVAGGAAAFSLLGGMALDDEALERLVLDLRRTDGAADALSVRYEGEPLTLAAELVGPEGGPFAALLGGPARFTANGVGREILALGTIGGAEALRAALSWTDAAWTLDGFADLGAIAPAKDLAARLGQRLTLSAAGGRPREDTAPFTLKAVAPLARLEAQGRIGAGITLTGPLEVNAEAAAETVSLRGGRIAFAGTFRPGEVGRLQGTVTSRGAGFGDVRVSGSGPALVEIGARRVTFDASLRSMQIAAQSPIVRRLLSGGTLSVAGTYARGVGDLDLRRFELTDSPLRVSARGPVIGSPRLNGRWTLADLDALDPRFSGRADGAITLAQPESSPWRLSLTGRAEGVSGFPAPLDALIGRAPELDVQLSFPGGPIRVDRATLQSRQLRFGAQGSLGETVALDWEASARGPVTVGGAQIAGAADLAGTVTGRLSNPAATALAQLDGLSVAGVDASRATVRLSLEPERGGARAGTMAFEGLVAGRRAEADARLVLDDGLVFEDAEVRWASFVAKGRAGFTEAGPVADASLSGTLQALIPDASGAIAGQVRLTSAADGARLDLRVNAAQARLPGGVRFTRAQARAEGLLDALAVSVVGAGAAPDGRPFSLDLSGRTRREEDTLIFGGDAEARVGDIAIASRTPVTIAFDEGETRLGADLAIGDGRLELAWRSGPRGVDGRAAFVDTPVAPFAAFAGEPALGSVSGSISLSGAGARLTGAVSLVAVGLRVQDRAADALDARLTGRLADDRFEGALVARSAAGLEAALEGSIPLAASASPLRIARAEGATAEASWRVQGPIGGLWAVLGPLNQRLTGRVEGAGTARLTGDRVSGDGRIALADGRFEDAATGIALRDIDAAVRFDQSGVVLQRLTATDGADGRLTGQGRLEGEDRGQLTLRLVRLQLVDREDVSAEGSGEVALVWRSEGATLTGALTLTQATAAPPQTQAAVPTLEVIEINRPEAEPGPEPRVRRPALPVALDLRIQAPGRVFTRTRGLDAEWALDVRVRGTAEAPLLYGEARLLRGTFDLAGRPFQLIEGLVRFDGPPEAAIVRLTAERDTPDLTARVLLEGTVADPEVTLTSTPALPEDEILPQVLFGRGAGELSAFEAAQLAGSLAALAGQSAFDIAAAARSLADLDRLEVREEEGGLLIAGGRYLTRDVYLEVSRGALGSTTTTVEWQVRPRLFLISSFRGEGEQKVAVRWRRDY